MMLSVWSRSIPSFLQWWRCVILTHAVVFLISYLDVQDLGIVIVHLCSG